MQRNIGSQKLTLHAYDATTGLPKTGDAANLTAYVAIDGGTVTVLADTSAAERDATKDPGGYQFDLAQAETDGSILEFSAKSTTANIIVLPLTVYTRPSNLTAAILAHLDADVTSRLAPTVAARTLDVAATGEAGVDLDNIHAAANPTTLTNITVPTVTTTGTATTVTNDVGITQAGADKVWGSATRTLSAFGFTVAANLTQIMGAVITGTAAQIVAAFTKFFDKAAPTGTINSLPDAVAGASGGLPTTNGTKVSQTVDLTSGQSIAASNFVAAPDAAGIRTAVGLATANLDAQFTGIPAAVWALATSGMSTVGSIGKKLADWVVGTIDTYTGNTKQTGDAYANAQAAAAAALAAYDTTGVAKESSMTAIKGGGWTSGETLDAIYKEFGQVKSDGSATYDRTTDSLQAVRDQIVANHTTIQNDITAAEVDPATVASAVADVQLATHQTTGSLGKAVTSAAAGSDPAAIADAVADEALSGHTTAGTLGKAISDAATAVGATPAQIADAVWAKNLSTYLSGAGYDLYQLIASGGFPVVITSGWIETRMRALAHELATDDAKQLTNDANYASHAVGAILEYSKLVPLTDTQTYSLTSGMYEYDMPTGWLGQFSSIESLEYPSGSQIPAVLPSSDYLVSGGKWRFLHITPNTGESAILTYSGLHTEDTVPAPDHEAVAWLGLSSLCIEMAARFAATSRPSVPADTVNYRTKSDEWRSLAKDCRGRALTILGANLTAGGGAKPPAAGDEVQWDW